MGTTPNPKTTKRAELSAQDLVVVNSRATGASHEETARLIHRSERTARRRAADPEVAEAIRRRREELAQEAVGRLVKLLPNAIETLGGGLEEDKAGDRLRAASVIITSFLRLRDQVEVDTELSATRELLKSLGNRMQGDGS